MPSTGAKPLILQDAARLGGALDPGHQGLRARRCFDGDGNAFEIVVVVVFGGLVMRGARGEIGFGGNFKADHHGGIELPVRRLDHLDRPRKLRADLVLHAQPVGRPHLIDLVEQDEVGAQELVLEDFFERIVVLHRPVGGALKGKGLRILGKEARSHRRPVDHRDDAVHRDAGADRRPVEGVDERLRQGEPGGLDEDMLRRVRPVEELVEGGDEVVGDGAADAAVRQFDDVLLGATADAAAFDEGTIEAEIAELVDDDREPAPARVLEEVAQERRLARAEKAGDDGAGDFRKVAHRGIRGCRVVG